MGTTFLQMSVPDNSKIKEKSWIEDVVMRPAKKY